MISGNSISPPVNFVIAEICDTDIHSRYPVDEFRDYRLVRVFVTLSEVPTVSSATSANKQSKNIANMFARNSLRLTVGTQSKGTILKSNLRFFDNELMVKSCCLRSRKAKQSPHIDVHRSHLRFFYCALPIATNCIRSIAIHIDGECQ
jgi:hypothetical protein